MNDGKQENNETSQISENEKDAAQAVSQNPEILDDEPLELNVEYKNEGDKPANDEAIESLLQQLEAVTLENRELKDKFMRTMADMENLRRRKDREIADKEKYAITSFAKEILSVADNIQRAIESVPKEDIKDDSPLKSLLEGVQMTEREFGNALEKFGIIRIDPTDQLFDPNMHQAMFEVEDPEKTSGTIVQVIQSGYQIGERVLRPAMVGISKGGAKASKAPVTQEENAAKEEIPEETTAQETSSKNAENTEAATNENEESGVGAKIDKSA